MIHYTPLSEHDIFEDDPTQYDQHKIVHVRGKSVKVQQLEDGSYQVVHLLSTNPQHYLDQHCMPGTILKQQDFRD
ncbi:YlzJ-like family protein [Pontibacillus litoralis]|uniref:Uncharacterized protein n=1 Tax=Pontibacillus litoralis JSM 072002 TaxID=1385512 RepID=A0A0A5GB21_9BACI|nr:YlzJ-like family protein [Pontibacillus litoralis]KGX88388.1 hypothetical protein N784_06915 [Pontibacillus litoralis JSM 072002]